MKKHIQVITLISYVLMILSPLFVVLITVIIKIDPDEELTAKFFINYVQYILISILLVPLGIEGLRELKLINKNKEE